MADPLRVFIAGGSAAERSELAARAEHEGGWVVVADPARADVVAMSPEEWARLRPRSGAARKPAREELLETLTSRELEVLSLVADGLHNRDIGARLGVSEHTVKFHLGTIFGKLGASTRTEAVQKGLRLGVIEI